MFQYPIIDLHATWLVINGIQGCPNKCKYCFLNGVNLTRKKPAVLVQPEVAVKLLKKSQYFNEEIPICIGTQTDIFSTPTNIEYAINLLKELDKNLINNPIIFITKCLIPQYFINVINEYKKKQHKFIFLLSYSGLENDIEIGINQEKIKNNFLTLYYNDIDIIHYWRPFLPQNSTKEKILEVYNFVKNYAKASVAIGLKIQENFVKELNFWEELEDTPNICEAESIWSKNGYEYIWGKNSLIDKDYPIYQTTSCAVAYVLHSCDRNAFFNSDTCKKLNKCPMSQRKICKAHIKNNDISVKYVIDLLCKVKNDIDKNSIKISIDKEKNLINIDGIELNMKEFTYLTQITHYSIRAKKNKNDYYWNTSVNDAKQLFI